jgi:hypothetical protein
VSLRFERGSDGATRCDVLEQHARLHVLSASPPQDAEDRQRWSDYIASWLLEHAPGRTAAALRIALGVDR